MKRSLSRCRLTMATSNVPDAPSAFRHVIRSSYDRSARTLYSLGSDYHRVSGLQSDRCHALARGFQSVTAKLTEELLCTVRCRNAVARKT